MSNFSITSTAKRVIDDLANMGWNESAQPACSNVSFESATGKAEGIACFLERSGEKTAVIAWDRIDEPLREKPEALFERFVDLTLLERVSLWLLGRIEQSDFVLVIADQTCALFSAASESLLGRYSLPREGDLPKAGGLPENIQQDDFLRLLREPDPERRPKPDLQRLADELNHWTNLLSGSLGPSLGWARMEIERLIRQLVLGTKAILCEQGDMLLRDLGHIGLTIKREDSRIALHWNPPTSSALAALLLERAAQIAPVGLRAFSAIEQNAISRQFESLQGRQAMILHDLFRLSFAKFQSATQVQALAPLEQEQESWRLALVEPLKVDEMIEFMNFYVYQPLVLNLSECGFGRVMEAIEKLALFVERQNADIEKSGGRQMDFVENDPEGLDEHGKQGDPFNWICARALRLKVAPQYRPLAAYLVVMKILDLRLLPPFRGLDLRPLTALPSLFPTEETH